MPGMGGFFVSLIFPAADHLPRPHRDQSGEPLRTASDRRGASKRQRSERSGEPTAKKQAGMLIMLYVGIRPGELLTIRAENVHPEAHYMTGGIKSERGKRRKLILPDKLLPIVREMLAHQKDGLLCWYKNKNDFYDEWVAKRTALGIREQLTPYCCRHTYITRLTALGVSPAMLQELAGHEDYDTTLDYTHLSVQDRLDAVNKL